MKLFQRTERRKINTTLRKALKRVKKARKDIEAIEQTTKLSPKNDFAVRVIDGQLNPIRRKLYMMVHFEDSK